MHSPPRRAFRARFVFSIDKPPVRDGVVTIGETPDGADVVDLGNVAIVSGLRNAHTHLELSSFTQPIGDPRQGFPAWIRDVVAWRRGQFETFTEAERWEQRRAAMERGLEESAAAGVTAIDDIVSPGWTRELSALDRSDYKPYQEVLGLRTNRIEELAAAAERFVTHHPTAGISPHAPYTVGVELLERLVKLSYERRFPLAMHLAESADELELLRSHSGAFYALLTELDAWDPSAFPRGIAPLDYLKLLAQAHSALVIHGNYLGNAEISFLAAHADRMTVIYCPRTHAYFSHPRYPLVEMLQQGVRVALGTDSRASNPDLNVWNEMRFVADTYPELALATIFRLAVDRTSTDMIVVDLPDEDAADPYELLFDPRSRVRGRLTSL
jgi:cytosine/adenosine deaminase-related metal-dependent hydrolase